MNTLSEPNAPSLPWWKYPHMWMVVGGPLIVVIASFVTLWFALHIPDPVYGDDSEPGESSQTAAKAPPAAATLLPSQRAASAATQASGKTPE